MGSRALEEMECALWDLSHNFFNERGLAWLPAVCPKCLRVLSAKTGATRLVCLGCDQEFMLTEVKSSE